jgi:uncharacterized protein YegP (UPF0339 family)
MKFVVYRSLINRQWYWHLKAANGEIIAQSEGYTTQANCLATVRLVQSTTEQTPVEHAPDMR